MRVVAVVISLTISAAGCAKKAPESPQPAPVTNCLESGADFEAGRAGHRAAVGDKGRACDTGPREAVCVSTRETGCSSITSKTGICTGEACAAVNRCDEAGNARTDETRATAAASNRCEARNAAARDRVEPNIGSDGAQGAAQVNQGDRHHDQVVAEESGGRSAGRIP